MSPPVAAHTPGAPWYRMLRGHQEPSMLATLCYTKTF